MSVLMDLLQRAAQHHRAGELEQAEHLYREMLAREPDNADARHRLGLLELAQGRPAAAAEHLQSVVESHPHVALLHHHLGFALSAAGEHQRAVEQFQEAIRLDCSVAEVHAALGTSLQALGQIGPAKAAYGAALQLRPGDVTAHFNLATALHAEGNHAEAAGHYRAALAADSGRWQAHDGLAQCLRRLGHLSDAIAHYESAVARRPDSADLHHELGDAWLAAAEPARAEACLRKAMELSPRDVRVMSSLGVALHQLRRCREAKELFLRAGSLEPADAELSMNLAATAYALAEYAEAEASYRRVLDEQPNRPAALVGMSKACLMQDNLTAARQFAERAAEIDPADVDARLMRGTLLLTQGEWKPGWTDLNWCLTQKDYRLHLTSDDPARTPAVWNGTPVEAANVLIHGEYGLGDTLHFIRYLPWVKQRLPHGRVWTGVHPRLVALLVESGFEDCVALDGKLPAFDVRVGMMSLPGIFEATPDTIPTAPYLAANRELVDAWRQRLADVRGFRIGIHWQGDPTFQSDRHRSIPLTSFAPLARTPGVALVSLQKGSATDQIGDVASEFDVIQFDNLDEQLGAFMDTAAIMSNLDLVITSDTAVAHLAGGLGIPVWVALARVADWRWMIDRDDSPWYPSMRLFRQRSFGDWQELFERMAGELTRLVRDSSNH
jgi:tetratricopeptide (TPR) repeat protein